jgi:hypothetical protein
MYVRPAPNRVAMNTANRAIACCLTLICIAALLSLFVPGKVEARDTRGGDAVADQYVMVGGEPGEDPHLRNQTKIIYVNEPQGNPGAGGSAPGRGGDSYRYGLNGCGGGETSYVGSRVDLVRRTLLQTLLWIMHQ